MEAINKIILGTVQFGLNYGINNTSGKPGQQVVNEMLATAYNSGIRCLDTAEAYGNAHEVIGSFHKNNPLQVFNVITKLPHHLDESLDQKIEKYLHDLNVDRLEGLLFHSYETYKNNKASIALLQSYKEHQKVKYLGVSVYTNYQIADAIDDDNIDIIQLPFNLFDNLNLRGEFLKKAKEKNKIIHTRSAFLQGLFFISPDKQNNITQKLKNELLYINQLSEQYNVSIQKMALNYCLQQPYIDNILIGVDNVNQLKQNLLDGDCSLSSKNIDDINSIIVNDVDLLNPSLWNQ